MPPTTPGRGRGSMEPHFAGRRQSPGCGGFKTRDGMGRVGGAYGRRTLAKNQRNSARFVDRIQLTARQLTLELTWRRARASSGKVARCSRPDCIGQLRRSYARPCRRRIHRLVIGNQCTGSFPARHAVWRRNASRSLCRATCVNPQHLGPVRRSFRCGHRA